MYVYFYSQRIPIFPILIFRKRRRECGTNEFGNEVYKVRFECEEPYPVYGARYFFELEEAISCPEFLVHFPTLVK